MTSTNTYTHSNYYLTLVCNIALKNKYTRWYFNIISRALERSRNRTDAKASLGYVEGHHILPTSFKRGGNKDPENIAFLTSREHFIVHAIMVKMFVDVYRMKMINAFLRMKTIGNKDLPNRYYNSHLFGYYRKYFSERLANINRTRKVTEKQIHCYDPTTFKRARIKSKDDLPEGWVLGCPLNTKGMISICNFETKETRRIRPNEPIPDGWVKGNYRNKGNKAKLGYIVSEETKQKISKANKGKERPLELRKRISETLKARYALKRS
jgi:NUMOD3 motif